MPIDIYGENERESRASQTLTLTLTLTRPPIPDTNKDMKSEDTQCLLVESVTSIACMGHANTYCHGDHGQKPHDTQ